MWVCWTQALSVPLSHTEQRCFSFTWQCRLVRQKLFGFSSRTTCQRLALKLNYHSKDKPKVCEYSDKVVGHSQPLPTHCDTLSRGCLWVWLLHSHVQKYMSVNNGDMKPVCSFVTEQSPLMCWVGFSTISWWTSLLVVDLHKRDWDLVNVKQINIHHLSFSEVALCYKTMMLEKVPF